MLISDWSSDVCSSDLLRIIFVAIMDRQAVATEAVEGEGRHQRPRLADLRHRIGDPGIIVLNAGAGRRQELVGPAVELVQRGEGRLEVGRAACRERGGQYV